jgi:hypothetical protein
MKLKLSIDLDDPDIKDTLQQAIKAEIAAASPARIDQLVDSALKTKLERVTDSYIDTLVYKAIRERVNEFANKPYGGTSPFQDLFRQVMIEMVTKAFTEKK